MKYILIAFIFLSCNNIHHNDSVNISTEALDTIKTRPAKLEAKPVLFEAAYIKGTTHRVKSTTISFYGITIGKIKIVSGYIIACDPGHIDEYGIPFTQAFPTGEFPVQLSILKLDEAESIAFARINFNDEPVEKWEFALLEGQDPIPVGGKKMHGYSVDLGVGIFVDKEAVKVLDQSNLTQSDAELYKEMDKHYHNDWKYTMYNFGTHNLGAFSTGFGDGYFATYIGFDAKGKPCRLLTDFGLCDWSMK
ncbi:MAG TPA: DUF4241 domain-containing protein [Ferruginibacter sp.]|nr:DUF4241 domain-containing protein [Ferruginibacter sp.]